MWRLFLVLSTALFLMQGTLKAQQLLLVSRENIRLRFSAGDPILYATEKKKRVRREIITSFVDDRIVLQYDTIAVTEMILVGSPDGRQSQRFREPGFKILIAGVLLGLGDFINVTAVQGMVYETDRGVIVATAALVAAGVILIVKKPVFKINRRNRLLVVPPESPLYR